MPVPTPNIRAVPSAARYQPGAVSLWVSVIGSLLHRTSRATRLIALLLKPGFVLPRGDHAHQLAHRGVPEPAQLGTDHLVVAEPVRGEADLGREARHGVRLQPELGDPEAVDHVLGVDPEVDRAVDRQHERVRAHLLAGIAEA